MYSDGFPLSPPEFQMSLLLFIAPGGYLIASRINQSAVIGLIHVGFLIGLSVLRLMSVLTTIITPIMYRNWFFKGGYSTYDAHV